MHVTQCLLFYGSVIMYCAYCIECNEQQNGWKSDYEAPFSHRNGDHSFCDLDTISLDTSLDEFIEKYYFKKPVLINTKLSDWTNSTFWNKNNLLSALGDYVFDSGTSLELVLNAGVGKQKLSLSQYIDIADENRNNYTLREPFYIFDRSIWDTENHHFLDNHIHGKNIKFFNFASSQIHYNGAILAVGNTGTGATWHAHGENFLFLMAGRKRWFFYPPNLTPVGGFWPGYTSKDWFTMIYPHLVESYDVNYFDVDSEYDLRFEMNDEYIKPRSNIFYRNVSGSIFNSLTQRKDILQTDFAELNDAKFFGHSYFKPIECMQSEGQMIYLPEMWWHSILNLGAVTIGAAVQTTESKTPWMRERDIHDDVRHGLDSHIWTDLETEAKRIEGINAWKRLSDYGPMNAVHEFFVGFEYYDFGPKHYDKAIQHLTNAILMDATYINAYAYLARIYMHREATNIFYDLYKAERIARLGYVLNPNNAGIRDILKRVFRRSGRRSEYELVKTKKPLPLVYYS